MLTYYRNLMEDLTSKNLNLFYYMALIPVATILWPLNFVIDTKYVITLQISALIVQIIAGFICLSFNVFRKRSEKKFKS